jgi:phage shock protein PspC (stress-responsive transcriptional regulator)
MAEKTDILSIPFSRRLMIAGVLTGFGGFFGIPFHMLQLGAIWTPLFIPIGIAACMVEPYLAILAAAIIPLLSGLQTGMPSFTPPFILLVGTEAIIFGLTISILRFKLKYSRRVSVLSGVIIGKIGLFLFVFLAGHPSPDLHYGTILSRMGHPDLWTITPAWNSVLSGLPGAVLVILVVPFIVKLIEDHAGTDNMAAA